MELWLSAMMMACSFLFLFLDVFQKIDLTHPVILFFYLPFSLNCIGLYSAGYLLGIFSSLWPILAAVALAFLLFYLWIRLHIFPVRAKHEIPLRLRVLIGGRKLLLCYCYASTIQTILSVLIIVGMVQGILNPYFWIASLILSYLSLFFLLLNGILRIFILSRRLSLTRRLLTVFLIWIPVVNLFLCIDTSKLVKQEYQYLCEKEALIRARPENTLCATRYPLLFVHGIGFRDFRYFNYWGRIPRVLKQNGAVIYYGNQEALGTAASNAEDIKQRILAILSETKCEKVNIIAHSKGGLDARYAISLLGMGPYVASLTTISTPHHGCRFVDAACKLPDGFYRFVASVFDKTFRHFGDRTPDFYTATRQFSTAYSAEFNQRAQNIDGVYYQSFASVMRHWYSDLLLALPYLLVKATEGENDGLVSVSSARWENFQGVFRNRFSRGISHGDMIDLKRQDYRGFDVTEAYVTIISDLKKRGF